MLASGPLRHRARRGAAVVLARCVGAVAAATVLAAAPVAQGAQFRLTDGVLVDGTVTHASDQHIALRTQEGVRLIHRDDIASVAVEAVDGLVIGAFKEWRNGRYRIASVGGDIEVMDLDAMNPAAAAETPALNDGDATLDIFASPSIDEPIDDEFRVRLDAPNAAAADPLAQLDARIEALGEDSEAGGAQLQAFGREIGESADGPSTIMLGRVDEAPAEGAEALGVLADENAAQSRQPAESVEDALVALAPEDERGGDQTAQADEVAAPPQPIDPLERTAENGDGASGDEAMRGMLSDLIFGGDGEADQAEVAAQAAVDAADRLGGAADAAGDTSAFDVAPAPAEAAVELDEAEQDEAEHDERSNAVVATQDFLTLSNAGGASASRDVIERGFSRDYQLAVSGAFGDQAPAASCVRMMDLATPPDSLSRERVDPTALIVASDSEFPIHASDSLILSWYESASASPRRDDTAADGMTVISQTADRLIRAGKVATVRYETQMSATAAIERAKADVEFTSDPAVLRRSAALEASDAAEAQAVLIGFDAVALAAPASSGIRSLSRRDLAALLRGTISDWSMIEPTRIGTPTLYLPPEGSSNLLTLLKFAGVRRAQPVAPRFVADAGQRVAAALVDPNGLVVAPMSVIGDKALPIGRASAAIAPSMDTLRSGAYPLTTPIYLRISPNSPHPAASTFADFLVSPSGQRALFDADLIPIAACDPSTCRMDADGFADARSRMARLSSSLPLDIEIDGALEGEPVARLSVPLGGGAVDPSVADGMKEFIALHGGGDEATAVAAVVAARVGPVDDEAMRMARIRGEAVALALRCAGMRIQRLVLDRAAPPADGVLPIEVLIE